MHTPPKNFWGIAIGVFLLMCLPFTVHAEPVLGAIREIEQDLEARVGFFMHDLHTGEVITYADGDRFPLNSTFKLLACGALLKQAESGGVSLSDTVLLRDVEIVDYSPAIEAHIRTGRVAIALDDACSMMLSVSDNTASNIVLSALGGPEALTAFLRSIGDQATRLDRWETDLNMAVPGDPRDTTTPRAIAQSVQSMVLGDTLSNASRSKLRSWLSKHRVADALFRASLPSNWFIHDRTGAGGYGSRSIVAIIYPPDREPIVTSLFLTETKANFASRNAAAARVGAAIVTHVTSE